MMVALESETRAERLRNLFPNWVGDRAYDCSTAKTI